MNKDRAEYLIMNTKQAKDLVELRDAVSMLLEDEVYGERAKAVSLAKTTINYVFELMRNNNLIMAYFIIRLIVIEDIDIYDIFSKGELRMIDILANQFEKNKNKLMLLEILNKLYENEKSK